MAMAERDVLLEEPLEAEVDPSLQRELHRHPGKWVAMTRHDLLAVEDTPGDALRAAVGAGCESPILYRVPTPDEARTYFLI
jgi:hypothetical protein